MRTVEIPYAAEPTTLAVGATYDTIADTNNLHRRVLVICVFAVGAAGLLGWLLAAFAVRPFRQAGPADPADRGRRRSPDVEVGGATEAVGSARRSGSARADLEEQDRTKAALASARDFAAVSAHELRTRSRRCAPTSRC